MTLVAGDKRNRRPMSHSRGSREVSVYYAFYTLAQNIDKTVCRPQNPTGALQGNDCTAFARRAHGSDRHHHAHGHGLRLFDDDGPQARKRRSYVQRSRDHAHVRQVPFGQGLRGFVTSCDLKYIFTKEVRILTNTQARKEVATLLAAGLLECCPKSTKQGLGIVALPQKALTFARKRRQHRAELPKIVQNRPNLPKIAS